jgi:uncharacterized membrane protein YvlD (DUF360 family)
VHPVSWLVQLIVVAVVIAAGSMYIPGVHVRGWAAASVASVVYAILAVLVGWLIWGAIALVTLPLTILTLGAFRFVIPWLVNAVLLRLSAGLMPSFDIDDWRTALVLSFLYSAALYVVRLAM